jgi:TP901 family phage tail tape measure protein
MARAVVMRIIGDERDLIRSLKKSTVATQTFGANVAKTQTVLKKNALNLSHAAAGGTGFARAMTASNGTLLGVGGLVYGLSQSAKAASNFELTMQKIVGLSGLTQQAVNGLTKEVLALGPAVGRGPAELAEALYFISSSGITDAATALDVLNQSARASAAGLGETQQVADAVTSVLNAYGPSTISAAQATDILVGIVREGKGEASEFAGVIGNVVSLASQLSVSFDEVGAALAAMTRLGTDPETAATQLQQVFSNLTKVTPQSEKALRSVGLTSKALRATLAGPGGLREGLVQIKAAFEGNIPAMAKAFGDIRALRGVLALVGSQADAVGGIFERLADSTGSAADAFGAVANTPAQKFARFGAAVDAVKIAIGVGLAPALADAAVAMTKWLGNVDNQQALTNGFRDAAGALKEIVNGVKLVIETLGGLRDTLTVLAGAWVGFKVKGIIAAQVTAAQHKIATSQMIAHYKLWRISATGDAAAVAAANTAAAGVTASVWRAALIATGWGAFAIAAGVAAAYVITNWTKVKKFFLNFAKAMVKTFEGMWEIIKGVGKAAVGSLLTTMTGFVRGTLELLAKIPGPMQDEVRAALDGLRSVTTDWINQGNAQMEAGGRAIGRAWSRGFTSEVESGLSTAAALTESFALKGRPRRSGGGAGKVVAEILKEDADAIKAAGKGITAAQRNTFFDNLIGRRQDRNQDIKTIQGQINDLQKIATLIRNRIKATKDVTRRLTLEDELVQVQRNIAGKQRELADNLRRENERAADARRASLAALLDGLTFKVDQALVTKTLSDDLAAYQALRAGIVEQLRTQKGNLDLQRQLLTVEQQIAETREKQATARQFRALGFDQEGNKPLPQVANLKKQLGQLTENLKGTFLDTDKTTSLMKRIKKVLGGGFGEVTKDVRAKVAAMFDDIRAQLKNFEGYKRTIPRQAFDPNKLLAGLGLSPEELKAVRGRIARIGPDGRMPGRGTGAFGMVQPVGGGSFQADFNLYIDGQQVETTVTRRNNARKRRNPPQKRGPTVAY